jgi:hypothetical protein
MVSRAHHTLRNFAATITLTLWMIVAGCGSRSGRTSSEINLVTELSRAERRALAPIDAMIRMGTAGPPADRREALLITAPARITWTVRLGGGAALRTATLLGPDGRPGPGVTLRIGISDQRVYEGLFSQTLTPARETERWQSVAVDLAGYGGWQWSLFYRPSETNWRLNVSVDATPGGEIALDAPRIERR